MLLHNFVLLMEMTFDEFFYDFLIKYFFPYISCVIKNVDKTLLDRIILVITKHSPSFILPACVEKGYKTSNLFIEYIFFCKNIDLLLRSNMTFMEISAEQSQGNMSKLREGNVFTGVCLFTWGIGNIKRIMR